MGRGPGRPYTRRVRSGYERVNDPDRLAAVRATALLDTGPEDAFDTLTAAATALLGTPFAFVTVVDDRRSFWKSTAGLPAGSPRQNTVEESFCRYVVETGEPLIVGDAANDPVTRDNPSIASMGVAAWAGFPVLMSDGNVLGTFCVVDQRPRTWSDHEIRVLEALAGAARAEVRLREALVQARSVVDVLERKHEATARLVAARTADEVARIALDGATTVLGARAAALSLLDDTGTQFVATRSVGFPAPVADGVGRIRMSDAVLSAAAVRSGQPVWVSGDEWRRRYPDSAAIVAGFASEAAALPLLSGGRCLGVLGLVFGDRPRTPEERSIARSLGQQCAQALERGRLYDRERRATEALQRSMLPGRIARIPGLDIAARYAPSGEGGRVGGDFYDLYEAHGGGWGAVVGDVCGKGAEAAAVTMLARQVLRAQADIGLGPAEALARLNRTLIAGARRSLTAADLRLGLVDGRVEVTLALGGHPRPILVPATGGIRAVGEYGNLLGFLPEPRLREVSFALGEGDALVLYTDGISEARREGVEFGEAGLIGVLGASRGLGASEIGDRVLTAVSAYTGGVAHDDIALLVLRRMR